MREGLETLISSGRFNAAVNHVKRLKKWHLQLLTDRLKVRFLPRPPTHRQSIRLLTEGFESYLPIIKPYIMR